MLGRERGGGRERERMERFRGGGGGRIKKGGRRKAEEAESDIGRREERERARERE